MDSGQSSEKFVNTSEPSNRYTATEFLCNDFIESWDRGKCIQHNSKQTGVWVFKPVRDPRALACNHGMFIWHYIRRCPSDLYNQRCIRQVNLWCSRHPSDGWAVGFTRVQRTGFFQGAVRKQTPSQFIDNFTIFPKRLCGYP